MQMMQKAQTIQKKLQQTQEELAQTEYTAETGHVIATCDGQGKFKAIKLAKEAINPENPESVDDDTVETLEDVISSVINNAVDKALKQREEKTVKITNGIRIPGLF